MRLLIFAATLLLASCASVESDMSSNDRLSLVRTRVDFNPITRPEREKLIQFEARALETATAPIKAELAEVAKARKARYEQIKGQFPDCEKQKHCISTLARGNVKDFERYNELTKTLRGFDLKTIELEASIRAWQNRYELRTRSINNRFLVHEILQLPKVEPRLSSVMVHSLQAFDSRRPLSERLLRLADNDAVATTWGDLNFTMLGRPVDEAAVIATFDVFLNRNPEIKDQNVGERFVLSFLVNSQNADSLSYDAGFLRFWAGLFVEREQRRLREKALCALYSIAGDTLVPKLSDARASSCAMERARMQSLPKTRQFGAEEWLLPIGYFHVQAE